MYLIILNVITHETFDNEFAIINLLQLGREVIDIAADAVDVGVTTEDIDKLVHEVIFTFSFHINCDGLFK